MPEPDPFVAALHEGRQRFLALVADIRPDLHRYCARMTGSVAEGEDIVQDTLARAYYALSEVEQMPPLRPWLFHIAHNRALDFLRRYDRRMGRSIDDVADTATTAGDPEEAMARAEAARAAISRFGELPPVQRSSVILKDVLGHSADEIGQLLGLSVPAVKAALHRGREQLRALAESAANEAPPVPRATSPGIARYVALFNARDWDGVRAMLAEDVRLDLVSRAQRAGRGDVSTYFTKYDAVNDWYLVPAWVDGREVVGVFRERGGARLDYFVELTTERGAITVIKDFRYVPYITVDAAIVVARE